MLTEQLDLTLRPNNINIMHLNVILPSMENKLFAVVAIFHQIVAKIERNISGWYMMRELSSLQHSSRKIRK